MCCSSQSILSPQCAAQSVGTANQLFASLVQTILAAHCSISPPEMWPPDYGPKAIENGLDDDFSFIVIGAGSAGSVLASRLSENPNWKVLLLEAGGDPPIESEIPGMSFSLQKTRVDWQFNGISKTACKAMVDGCYWPRGKVLGGSSTINSMEYVRGIAKDYDYWAELGNFGWDFESVLPFFKKSENQQQKTFVEYENGRYHSNKGPMKVDFLGPIGDIEKIFIAAANESGIPFVDDINADKHHGFISMQGTIADARRQSTAKAFLMPAKNRRNLKIIKHAFVEKILIDENKRAYGVQFVVGENCKTCGNCKNRMIARAQKEVILSAGAVMSPILLMLSGVGPANELANRSIPVKSDLIGVGQNLFDHIYALLIFKFDAVPSSPTDSLDYLYQFLTKNAGPYALPTQMAAFLSTTNDTSTPDIELYVYFFPPNSPDFANLIELMNYQPEIKQHLYETNAKFSMGIVLPVLLHPKSSGFVKLNGTCAHNKPKIFPNYFKHQDDIDRLVVSIKQQVAFTSTKAYQSFGGEYLRLPIPKCDQLTYESDEYWRCYISYMSMSDYHGVGTCKMGPITDRSAVVDARLNVYNISSLRVVDASIFPYTVSGNTNAASIMVGEKGADMIKEDYLL
ncbi:glucose dehydrogenase [FAD, quinone]-like [Contarinia nasturtii]|uniref:glucose dehydrogenase [FAD, quinone]-like n=1 Tax=Contarinia nasturtii TaxID=265458 RepID=UPI0012D39BF6|nr:glucose dehydrogenase [FAD, quinone]-like [Contarinia nasturtii]